MSRILLAPMEGLADWLLRDVLTQAGGYDVAVGEFVRVAGPKMPSRSFLNVCPELGHGGRTSAGVPVVVQLLGNDPGRMAESAAQLARLSPPGIDLNFGCPAPTVNRSGAGAVLLEDPALVGRIVSAVRRAVPAAIPVSAKMRLGVSDTATALECAHAIVAGGASSLVVHARTRDEFYRPPAHWEWIARIREAVSIPVVANGEVWSLDDYLRCRQVTGCDDVMIGRGAVADPLLARRIKAYLLGEAQSADERSDWNEVAQLVAQFWRRLPEKMAARYRPGRIKMWLRSLSDAFSEAEMLYRDVRMHAGVDAVSETLARHGVAV